MREGFIPWHASSCSSSSPCVERREDPFAVVELPPSEAPTTTTITTLLTLMFFLSGAQGQQAGGGHQGRRGFAGWSEEEPLDMGLLQPCTTGTCHEFIT